MNRFLACLALCASLSASAQGDNCTVLGIQDLTQMVFELQGEIDSLKGTGMTRDSVIAIAIHKELSIDEVTGGDLSTIVIANADLSGADLSRANLSRANLSGADLRNADLAGADLSGADLSGADLSGAVLSFADLSRADLSGANLSGAVLSGADLSGADLYDADLFGAQLAGADLTGASMSCLISCPASLPLGYTCEPTWCSEPDRRRIVPD